MASVIDLYVDLRNRRLISGQLASAIAGGGDWAFPRVLHSEVLNLRWRFLQLNTASDPKNPNALVPINGAALTVAVYSAARVELAKTLPGSWTGDTAANTLSGQLNLDTVIMGQQFDTTVPGVFSITATMEVRLVLADGTYGFQFLFQIDKSLLSSSSSTPVPSSGYLTREESLALFVKYINNPAGATVTLTSPDGLSNRTLGVNDDGSAQDDLS